MTANRSWIRAALLAGGIYFIIGRAFTLPAGHVRAWRLAAWAVSFAVYAAHIAYEHFALRAPTRPAASHVALAVGIGAFSLALAGMVHSFTPWIGIRPLWALALFAWPVMTALPAFLGALIAGAVLRRFMPAR